MTTSNLTIAGLAGCLIFSGAATGADGMLDRFMLASLAAGSGAVATLGMQAGKVRSCRDEIDLAVRKARLEGTQNLENLEAGHRLEITKIRKDLQTEIDRLSAEKLAIQASFEADRQKLQESYETRLNGVVESHTSAITGIATEQRRSLASELRERDERLEKITADHAATLDRLHTQIGDLRAELEKAQLDREELLRLEYGRELHAMELSQKDDTIANLQNQISGLQARLVEVGERLDDEYDSATQAGFREASEQYEKAIAELERQHEHAIQSLQNRIGQLETQLDKRKSRAAFEASLPSLWSFLDDLLPLIITAPQRRGKGTSCARVAQHYGSQSKAGIIPIVFDPSEGGQAKSTWDRAGIPSFSDPYLALELLEAVANNAASRPISDRSLPPIMLGFDELTTCLNSLDKDSRERFGELWKHTHTDWLKRRIFPVIMSHSRQIQNMNSGGEQLLNGGLADTAFGSILIDTEIQKFLKDRGDSLKTGGDIAAYLRAYEGCFTASFFKAGKLTPIKHPSHHGLHLGNAVAPVDAVEIKIAPCPSWFPHAIRELYAPYYDRAKAGDHAGATACKAGASADRVQPVETLSDKDLHADPRLQKWGQIAADLGFSDDELLATIAAVEAGKNQGDTLRSALGIKSRSGNPESAYARGRQLYQVIRSAYVTA